MKKIIYMVMIFFLPVIMYSQEQKTTVVQKTPVEQKASVEKKTSEEQKAPAESKSPKSQISVQAQYSNDFILKSVYFNRVVDFKGRGEVLEVEFVMENKTDYPIEFYLFTIATYEVHEKSKSSFGKLIPAKEQLRSFVPYPEDKKNFQYPILDDQGNIKKDKNGRELYALYKFPHDPKAGINPKTGKLYTLNDKLFLRTFHLSEYRNNYFFFNYVVILIFDKNGNPVFRQLYELKGFRR